MQTNTVEAIPGKTYQNALGSTWKVVKVCGNGRIECEIKSSTGRPVKTYMSKSEFANLKQID